MAKEISLMVECGLDIPKHLKKIQDDTFWLFAASTWHTLYSPYVPYNTGQLMEQVKISPKQIKHTVPYAARQYTGNFDHNTERHPKASRKWDAAAIPAQKPRLIKSMQEYVDAGKLHLMED